MADATRAACPFVVDVLRKLIEMEIARGLAFYGPIGNETSFDFLHNTDACWSDPGFLTALAPILDDKRLTPGQLFVLLRRFLKARSSSALKLAIRLLGPECVTDPLRRHRAILVSETLLQHDAGSAWPAIWSLIMADTDFGSKLLGNICQGSQLWR